MRRLLALATLLLALPLTAQVSLGGPINSYGDSITAGAFVAAGQDYPTLVRTYYNVAGSNYALQGDTSCEMTDKVFTHENPGVGGKGVYTAMIGTNDVAVSGIGSYEPVYQTCHLAALSWLATARSNKVFARDAACVQSGTWTNDTTYQSIGLTSSAAGSTLSCNVSTAGRPIYIWYRVANGTAGSFTYSVDGAAAVSLTSATSPSIATYNGVTKSVAFSRVPVGAGQHTVQFAVSSGTASILAVGTPSPNGMQVYSGGVPYEAGDADSAKTAQYNADSKADAALLASDGAPVYFVDVRQYLCTSCATSSPDMANTQHPNAQGQAELATGWESAINAHFTRGALYWPLWMTL